MEYLKKLEPAQDISLFFLDIRECLVSYSALVRTTCLAKPFP